MEEIQPAAAVAVRNSHRLIAATGGTIPGTISAVTTTITTTSRTAITAGTFRATASHAAAAADSAGAAGRPGSVLAVAVHRYPTAARPVAPPRGAAVRDG